MNKIRNYEQIKEKLDILKKYKIQIHLSFIIGLPGDEIKDIIDMIELIKDVKPDLVSINRLLLMPGTKLYEDPDVYGIKFITKEWYENECWTDKQLYCTEKLSYEQIEELSILMRKSFLLEKLDEK